MHKRFGISGKLLRVIMDLFHDIVGTGIVNNMMTRSVQINSEVLQGSVLGPILFLMFIDDLLEELHDSRLGIPLADFVLTVLAYADDITLLSLQAARLQHLLDICNNWSKKNGMTFSLDKSFVVAFNSRSKKPSGLPIFYLGKNKLTTTFPEKTKETYLGFNITDRVAKTKIDWNTTFSKN